MYFIEKGKYIRKIHSGYVKRVLESNIGPSFKRYEQIVGDNRERWNDNLNRVKYEKDKLTSELARAKRELVGLFDVREAAHLLDSKRKSAKYDMPRENEARRIYRLLRPEASSFFEEQTSTYLKTKTKQLLLDSPGSRSHNDSAQIVPIDEADVTPDAESPVFTSSCYTLSVVALLNSMSQDLRAFCAYLGIEELPEANHNSFNALFDKLEHFFKLRLDASNADEWTERVWPKLRPLLVPELSEISSQEMSSWLKAHLNRVSTNLKSLDLNVPEWYDFTTHLLYDSVPFPEKVAIEDEIGYSLSEAASNISKVLSLFKDVDLDNLNELVDSLKRLGLRDWFKLTPNEIETSLFGTQDQPLEGLEWTAEDHELSYLLIETVARSMDHLLDIESYSPSSVLSTISKNLKSSLFESDENKWLPSDSIREMISKVYLHKSHENDLNELIETPLRQMLMSDYKYSHQIGPIILYDQNRPRRQVAGKDDHRGNGGIDGGSANSGSNTASNTSTGSSSTTENTSNSDRTSASGDSSTSSTTRPDKDEKNEPKWKWVVPSVDSIFDANRNMYIRNKSNLDPLMRLDNLKSFILARKRMRSMTKEGRVYFIRVVVAVGDGNGYFGMGIGYGNDINSAKNAGIENALKNMFFLDYDPRESLTTPVMGREYGSRCVIEGRPAGSGVKCNRKFLPLLYLVGLDNVTFRLRGTHSWVTRIRSIRRALEAVASRRTLSNMLGKRYAEVAAPGDHAVHWSDAWFTPVLREYQARISRLRRLRFNFSRRNRFKYNILLPTDVGTLVPSYNRGLMSRALRPKGSQGHSAVP